MEEQLARALRIYTSALSRVSGLARTVRGPSMSATPGKVLVDGVTTINGERVFVLKIIQGRDPEWTNRVFFAHFDSAATWLDGSDYDLVSIKPMPNGFVMEVIGSGDLPDTTAFYDSFRPVLWYEPVIEIRKITGTQEPLPEPGG